MHHMAWEKTTKRKKVTERLRVPGKMEVLKIYAFQVYERFYTSFSAAFLPHIVFYMYLYCILWSTEVGVQSEYNALSAIALEYNDN